MLTLLTAWISQRIITVVSVAIVTAAAVPTTLVITSNHDDQTTTTVAVLQPADDHTRVALVGDVKTAGDAIIARLNQAEASCDSSLTRTVSTSTVAAKIQPALSRAKTQLHSSVSPIVAAIKSDEDHFAHLSFVSKQDEENELEDLNLIEILALGKGQTPGTVSVTCQTVTVTITETIQITVIQEAPQPCPPSRDENDND